ncbi:MAG: DoxX family protein [Pirellulales bacterium]
MQSTAQTAGISKASLLAGRTISTLAVLFLLFDGVTKVLKVAPVMEACAQLGIPESVVPGIGIVLLICTVVYVNPRTSVLGAILLTGYLGGATATHVRVGGPVFPVVFAVVFGALVWLGLFLRDDRLRTLIPLRR